ncbi:hypothetical protein EOD40_02690 [Flavobacterium sufflavum]|uniref:Uncharacterized protein n=1 Tax=Flavobacterium sufflavum TaxID=1921138 RepID=A0A437L3Z3_9FLAO|nr:hypothetical protein [Flavobacterium sufflavum]RVT80037.1 hypothetical protein EOD40_02690 [Flavobacterium sufflavum]
METNYKINQMNDDELNKIHSDSLGLNVPENYFLESKNDILNKVLARKEPKTIPFYRRKATWFAAATLTLLLGLAICNKYNSQDQQSIANSITDSIAQIDNENGATAVPKNNYNNPIPNNSLTAENDILVSSLFVEEKEVDEYITNYILEDI